MKNIRILFLCIFLFIGTPFLKGAPIDSTKRWLSFNNTVPEMSNGVAGAFVGVTNNVLIVAGGIHKTNTGQQNLYSDSIFVCTLNGKEYNWKFAGKLPRPVAHGATVVTDKGLLCIAGEGVDKKYENVFLLRWNADSQQVTVIDDYPSFPEGVSHLSASSIANVVYAIGGETDSGLSDNVSGNLWQLDMREGLQKRWQKVGSFPGEARYGASLIKQSNGEYDCLFFFGGKSGSGYRRDSYIIDLKKQGTGIWKQVSDMPGVSFSAPALAVGGSKIFVFSSSEGVGKTLEGSGISRQGSNKILSYNSITDTWYSVAELTEGIFNTSAIMWQDQIVIPGGELINGSNSNGVITASINTVKEGNFSFLDYTMLFFYLGLIAWLGYYFSSKNKSSKDFFLGGQKIPFWAAGLSMMAAQVSSIGFMSIPAKSFATNWSYFAGILTWFIAVPIVIYAFVPFYRRLNVTSAYEYLEKRFNPFIRKFIAALYLLFQLIGRLAAIIFLPAIALSAVTGINTIVCIIIIGGLSTVYTVLGGMHAVIWIDVIQAIVMFGGIFAIIAYILFKTDGGLSGFAEIAWNDNKFSLGSFDLNLTSAVFWVIIIGNIFQRLGTMSSDQSVVQRYLTTRNEKETAKALWTDVAVSIPWAIAVFGLGTALYVFYKANPGLLDPSISNDEIVPFFIGQNLPSGISGIIIAAIFAASMSSVDSSIHSSTTVLMKDFIHRWVDAKSELKKVSVARWITTGLGILGTAIAIVMTFFDITSVWDIVLEFAGLFTGAVTGIFILGIFSDRANGKGATVGVMASAVVLMLVKSFTPLHFFLYSGIGVVSCVLIGYLASFLFTSAKSTEGLTIYSVLKNK